MVRSQLFLIDVLYPPAREQSPTNNTLTGLGGASELPCSKHGLQTLAIVSFLVFPM